MKFYENGTLDMRLEIKILSTDFEDFDVTVQTTCEVFFGADPEQLIEVEDLSADGNLHCIANVIGSTLQKFTQSSDKMSLTNGIYTIKMDRELAPVTSATEHTMPTTLNIEFPGPVIEASA